MNALRGGGAWSGARFCRSACRIAVYHRYRSGDLGFRTKCNPCYLVNVRGGSWSGLGRGCRAAFRYQDASVNRWNNRGFRTKTS